jgi:hypothetical protein
MDSADILEHSGKLKNEIDGRGAERIAAALTEM